MKKQEILNYLAAAVVLMLAIGHVYAVVKGKVTPVRAGISTHTTYGAISTEETLTLGEPAKSRRAIAGASDVTAENPIIIYGFYLEGRSCRISAGDKGVTKVEVKIGNDWEEAAVENENGKTVDWSQVIIFPGYHHEKKEGGNNLQTAPSIGDVNITMTGGKVYGIYGAGTTDTDELFTGSVEGNVTVTITGGEVHELSNLGTCAVKQGENQTGYLFGNYNLIMTGGRYTGNTLQAIRSRVDSNVATHVSYITTSTAIIANVDFDFKEAVPCEAMSGQSKYIELAGRIVQETNSNRIIASGTVTIPSGVTVTLDNLFINSSAQINNYGTIEVTTCNGLENYGTVSGNDISVPSHDFKTYVSLPATCMNMGTCSTICTKCGECDNNASSKISMTDHTWGTIPAHAANCYEDGYDSYEGCVICGVRKDKETPIVQHSKVNHLYVWEDSCNNESGCKDIKAKKGVCQLCGDVEYDYEVSPVSKSHAFGEWTYDPQSGKETRKCSTCLRTDERNHLEHNFDAGCKSPTCTEAGRAECLTCYACKDKNGNFTVFGNYVDVGDAAGSQMLVYLPAEPVLPNLGGHDYTGRFSQMYVSEPTCEHGAMRKYVCKRCGEETPDDKDVFEDKSYMQSHSYTKVVSIRPDANFAEAGQIQLECETCHRVASFDYNIYTDGSISKNTPRNPTSLYTETSLNKAGEHDKEATCITGRTPRHVSLYNGQSSNPTLLAENLDVSAVLSVVKGKHAWDADGHCRNCGESDEAYIRRQVTIQPDESSVVLTEELFETYQTLDGDNQTKWQESVMNANETEGIRVGVFCDVEWKDEMTVNKPVEFALNGHTLNVPSGIVQENQSAINVTSGTLTTPSVTGDGPKTVDRDQGASFVIDMSDDVPYSQNTQVSGVDARYARTFEVANVWQAMSVPFAVMPDAETLIGCDIAAVYFQSNPDGVELIIRKVAVDERLYANRAYLVCPKNTGKYNFTAANVTVEDAIESADNDFVCTPTTVDCQGEIFLGYDDDKQPVLVRNNNEGVKMKPFRWYVNQDALQKRLKDVPNDVRRKVQGPDGKEGYYLGKVTLTVDKSIDVVDAANLIGMLTGDKAMNVAADADNNGVTNAEDVKKVVNIILGADDAIFITTEDKVLRVPATIKSIPAVDQVPL